jgi:acetyl-CoA carboxylase biotin carboxyl carrier protein
VSDLPLSPDDVAEIVSLLDGGGYDRLDIRTTRFRLRVNHEGSGWTQEWDYSDNDAPAAAINAAVEGEALPDGVTGIAAPLPGTFYRAPSPGAPPFVDIGDTVTPDTVVGIIETMKLMNPVHAGTSGVIAAILADNAAMIENAAVLMHVRSA